MKEDAKNTFSINSYEANFVRFHVDPVEAIYVFVELCKLNHAIQMGMIIRPTEILVDRYYISDFLGMFGISFIDDNLLLSSADGFDERCTENCYSRKTIAWFSLNKKRMEQLKSVSVPSSDKKDKYYALKRFLGAKVQYYAFSVGPGWRNEFSAWRNEFSAECLSKDFTSLAMVKDNHLAIGYCGPQWEYEIEEYKLEKLSVHQVPPTTKGG